MTRASRAMLGLLPCVGAVVGSAAVAWSRQPSELPMEVDPGVPFDEARAAYRLAPVADDMTVSITPPGEPARSERLGLRIDAAGTSAEDGPRRLLLELGALRVYIGENRLVATHNAEPGAYFESDFAFPISLAALDEVLPPIPLPQLALLCPGDPAVHTPTPYTKGVTWTAATLEAGARPPVFRVQGAGFDGPVTLMTHASSGRLIRFTASFPGGGGETFLEVASRPIDPGDPASWSPDISGRTRVRSLAELRGQARAPLREGDPAPDITLLGADLSAWSLHTELRAGRPVVLLLFRVPDDAGRAAAAQADARAGLDALRAVRASGPGGEPRAYSERAAAVIELGSFERDGFLALRERWGTGAPSPRRGSDELLWASSAGATIDRFSKEAGAILIVIRPDRTIGAALGLDGRGAAPRDLRERLAAALSAG